MIIPELLPDKNGMKNIEIIIIKIEIIRKYLFMNVLKFFDMKY